MSPEPVAGTGGQNSREQFSYKSVSCICKQNSWIMVVVRLVWVLVSPKQANGSKQLAPNLSSLKRFSGDFQRHFLPVTESAPCGCRKSPRFDVGERRGQKSPVENQGGKPSTVRMSGNQANEENQVPHLNIVILLE
jgi:hypothetical protein